MVLGQVGFQPVPGRSLSLIKTVQLTVHGKIHIAEGGNHLIAVLKVNHDILAEASVFIDGDLQIRKLVLQLVELVGIIRTELPAHGGQLLHIFIQGQLDQRIFIIAQLPVTGILYCLDKASVRGIRLILCYTICIKIEQDPHSNRN